MVALTDASGNVVERYRYDPYGMTRIYNAGGMLLPTSAYGNPYAYTGQRYDAAVTLYHFWYRTYSPFLGRWHQRDPIGYIDGVSLCEYVASSPISSVDPFGTLAVETQSDDWIHRWFWGHFFDDDYLTNMTDGQMVAIAGGGAVSIVVGGYVGYYLPEIIAAAGPAGASGVDKISGYTRHGLNQAISRDDGRGVSPSAILDALRNPTQVIAERGTTRYVGERATVVVSETTGKIMTTWANTSSGCRSTGGN